MKNLIKKIVVAAIAVVTLASCTTIEPGEVGLKVHKLGDKKGEIELLDVGREPVSLRGAYEIISYPTSMQQASWTADEIEGSPDNEEVFFQAEGQAISVDLGISFQFQHGEGLIPMYRRFASTPSPDDIARLYLRKDARSFLNDIAATMKVDSVNTTGKEILRKAVLAKMQEKYDPMNIIIEDVTFLSNFRLPKAVQDAVDAKVAAQQQAEQRQYEVAEAEAQANKDAAAADGRARAMIREAEGRAEAIRIEGEAIARNSQYLKVKELEVQAIMAESAKGWNYVNLSAEQSATMLNLK